MRNGPVYKWIGIAVVGGFSAIAAWLFGSHPYYGLMLMYPLVLITCYLALYGGSLAFLIGLAMAIRTFTRR